MELEGYARCRGCDELHPKILLQRTGGACRACIQAKIAPISAAQLEIGGELVRMRRHKRSRAARGALATKRTGERAALAAMRRLRDAFPDLYLAFLADERAARGLEAWPVQLQAPDLDLERLEYGVQRAVETLKGSIT